MSKHSLVLMATFNKILNVYEINNNIIYLVTMDSVDLF